MISSLKAIYLMKLIFQKILLRERPKHLKFQIELMGECHLVLLIYWYLIFLSFSKINTIKGYTWHAWHVVIYGEFIKWRIAFDNKNTWEIITENVAFILVDVSKLQGSIIFYISFITNTMWCFCFSFDVVPHFFGLFLHCLWHRLF